MSLEDIVNVQISRETTVVSRKGFGTALILGINKAFSERIRYYSSLKSVLNDFQSVDKEYICASDLFAQNPAPLQVAIGRRDTSDTSVVTVDTVLDLTKYTVTINGTGFEFTSDASATAPEIGAGLVALINGGAEPVTATDNLDGTFDLVADVAGVFYSLAVDSNQSIAYTLGDTPANDLQAIRDESDDWYALIYVERTLADQKLLADAIEGMDKIYAIGSADSDIVDTTVSADATTIAYYCRANSLARSSVWYLTNGATQYPEAGILGNILPLDPGSYTSAFKTLSSITVDNLSDTKQKNALDKNANIYVTVGGVNITREGKVGEGEWLDIIIGVDWLKARMTERLFGILVNTKKLPYTNDGITAVESEISAQLQEAISQGLITPDEEFIITVPRAEDVSVADKGNRILRNVTFSAVLAGAIHAMVVEGTVSL